MATSFIMFSVIPDWTFEQTKTKWRLGAGYPTEMRNALGVEQMYPIYHAFRTAPHIIAMPMIAFIRNHGTSTRIAIAASAQPATPGAAARSAEILPLCCHSSRSE